MYCTHCGKENKPQNRFCIYCGKPFYISTQQAVVTPPVYPGYYYPPTPPTMYEQAPMTGYAQVPMFVPAPVYAPAVPMSITVADAPLYSVFPPETDQKGNPWVPIFIMGMMAVIGVGAFLVSMFAV